MSSFIEKDPTLMKSVTVMGNEIAPGQAETFGQVTCTRLVTVNIAELLYATGLQVPLILHRYL
jgi:hypothetical protein